MDSVKDDYMNNENYLDDKKSNETTDLTSFDSNYSNDSISDNLDESDNNIVDDDDIFSNLDSSTHVTISNNDFHGYRSGFVAVVGRPNVGKSTLMNALIGTHIAISSSRPETTRKAIRGIVTTQNAQMVIVDTPGIHRPRTLLGQRLNDIVDESLSDVDVIAFLLPADQEIGPGDRRILSRLRADFAKKMILLNGRGKSLL